MIVNDCNKWTCCAVQHRAKVAKGKFGPLGTLPMAQSGGPSISIAVITAHHSFI